MDKPKIEIPHRTWLSIIFTLAWCSGVVFFILKTWFMVEGDFGPENHPYQFFPIVIDSANLKLREQI